MIIYSPYKIHYYIHHQRTQSTNVICKQMCGHNSAGVKFMLCYWTSPFGFSLFHRHKTSLYVDVDYKKSILINLISRILFKIDKSQNTRAKYQRFCIHNQHYPNNFYGLGTKIFDLNTYYQPHAYELNHLTIF